MQIKKDEFIQEADRREPSERARQARTLPEAMSMRSQESGAIGNMSVPARCSSS
jgi:hypothetical protein